MYTQRHSYPLCAGLLAMLSMFFVACTSGGTSYESPKTAPPSPGPKTKLAWQERWDRTLEAAQKEGTLTIYASLGPQSITALTRNAKNTLGLDLQFVTLPAPAELLARVQTERRAGIYSPDVFIFGATSLLNLFKPQGILDRIEPLLILPEVTDPKGWVGGQLPFVDADRLIIGFTSYPTRYVTRNIELVKEEDIKSYRDLANPRWKGKLAMYDPTTTGSGNSWVSHLVSLWGQDETRNYLKEIAKLEPVITRDKHVHVEWVARGKYSIAIATDGEKANEFLKLGAPIAHVFVTEGTTLTTGAGVTAVPDRRPHPNAATVFVNWLLTREGQAVFAQAFGKPSARVDIPVEGFQKSDLLQPGEKFIKDDEERILMKGKLVNLAREVFGAK